MASIYMSGLVVIFEARSGCSLCHSLQSLVLLSVYEIYTMLLQSLFFRFVALYACTSQLVNAAPGRVGRGGKPGMDCFGGWGSWINTPVPIKTIKPFPTSKYSTW